jgi:DNA polymerase III subunit gamma/tau
MSVLYQKYRPRKFSEIWGQNHIKATLQNEIASEKISHAYLFCGPRAVGKTTLARVFSKAINCENRKKKESEPCDKCDSCSSINNFKNMDIIEIDAASNTGVDNVRNNIISSSQVKSSKNKFKVFIIDEVHMLSLSAFNALLKTLEEPPSDVIFILCTTEAHKIPATIISRCERFDFKRININDTLAKLKYIAKKEKIDIDEEVLRLIAMKSDGHLRDAEGLLGQIMAINSSKISLEDANIVLPVNNLEDNLKLLENLSKKDTLSAIKLVNDSVFKGRDIKSFLNDLTGLLRKMILIKINDSLSTELGLDLDEKSEIKISKINKEFSLKNLINISERFISARKEISFNTIPQMPIELAIIDICGPVKFETGKKEEEKEEEVIRKEEKVIRKEEKEGAQVISKEKVEKHWPDFIAKLKPHNHSLSFIMQSCKINKVSGNKICLSLKYKFHKDRLDDPEIKKIIDSSLKDIFNLNLGIESMIDKNIKTKKNDDQTINNLLETFGGKVIN